MPDNERKMDPFLDNLRLNTRELFDDVPQYDQFVEALKDSSVRRKLHESFSERFTDVPSYYTFDTLITNALGETSATPVLGEEERFEPPKGLESYNPLDIPKSFAKGVLGTAHGIAGFLDFVGLGQTNLEDLTKYLPGPNIALDLVQAGLDKAGADVELGKIDSRMADAFTKQIEKNYLETESDNMVNDLFQGLGSAASFFIPGLGAAKLAIGAGRIYQTGKALLKGGYFLLDAIKARRMASLFGTTVSAFLEAAVESGSTFQESLEKGDSRRTARNKATGVFAANMALGFATDKWFFNPEVGSFLKRILKGATNEGTQEFLQSMISSFAQGDDIFSKEILRQAGYEGLLGGIVGGGIGGVQGAMLGKKPKIDPSKLEILTPQQAQEHARQVAADNGITEQELRKIENITPEEAASFGVEGMTQEELDQAYGENAEYLQSLGFEKPDIVNASVETQLQQTSEEIQQAVNETTQMANEAEAALASDGDESVKNEIMEGMTAGQLEELTGLPQGDIVDMTSEPTSEILSEEGQERIKRAKEGSNPTNEEEGLKTQPEPQTSENAGQEYKIDNSVALEDLKQDPDDIELQAEAAITKAIISKDTKGQGKWRISYFDNENNALGHSIHDSFQGAEGYLKQAYDLVGDSQNTAEVKGFEEIIDQFGELATMSGDKKQRSFEIAAEVQKLPKDAQLRLKDYIASKQQKGDFTSKYFAAQQMIGQAIGTAPTRPQELDQQAQQIEQAQQAQENTRDEDVQNFEESESEYQPRSGTSIANNLLTQGFINDESYGDHASYIVNLAKTIPEAKTFLNEIRVRYPNLKMSDEDIYKAHRRERTLKELPVFDIDSTIDQFQDRTFQIIPSTFHNHKGVNIGNKYLIDDVLLPFIDRLAVFNLYNSKEFNDSDNYRKDVMPYDRQSNMNTRDLQLADIIAIEKSLNTKGYTLLPLSDSNTFLVLKLDDKYRQQVGETQEQRKKRLLSLVDERSADYWKDKSADMIAGQLSRQDFLRETLGDWYSTTMQAAELAKRFKLFLPKGEKLEFHRDITITLAKDKEYKGFRKADGTPLVVTDGTTFANPRFYRSFTEYNKLGNIQQHKTIITGKTDQGTFAFKHLTHVLSQQDWDRITTELGIDPETDMIAFESSAKIAHKAGQKIANGTRIKLPPSAFRHIFSGKTHDRATFSRQIFNYMGASRELMSRIKNNIITPISKEVKGKYLEYMRNPAKLQEYMMQKFDEITNEISDFRRYASLNAMHFKILRSDVQAFLKNDLIQNDFIKLKHAGNFSYLKPDYWGQVNEGEIHLPDAEFRRIFNLATKAGFNKHGKHWNKFTSLQGNERHIKMQQVKNDLNEWLKDNPLEVITFRPPIPRVENIQVLRVTGILGRSDGNAAIMNTKDAIINKEADFDGDEVFFHYISDKNDFQAIADKVRGEKGDTDQVTLNQVDIGESNTLENLAKAGFNAGIGKRAVGETAKAITMKAIIEANNLKIGVDVDGNAFIITPSNRGNAVEVYGLRSDLHDWNNKIAHTLQASVDNLKLNALTPADNWYIQDGIVNYYLPDIYAGMFEEGIDGKQVMDALKPIGQAINLFTSNFEEGGVWKQDDVNKVAQEYRKFVEESDGALGASPHEFMIMELAEMGYATKNWEKYTDFRGRTKWKFLEGANLKIMNDLHDKAHSFAYKEFFERFILNGDAKTLSDKQRKSIEDEVEALYKAKQAAEGGKQREERFYTALYKEFLDKKNAVNKDGTPKLTPAMKDYYDYVVMRGFTIRTTQDGNQYVHKRYNTRFPLAVMENRNITRLSNIFNKKYAELMEARRGSITLAFSMGGLPIGAQTRHSKESMFERAKAFFWGDVLFNFRYRKELKSGKDANAKLFDQQEMDSLRIMDRINRVLWEIGKQPFSDQVDMNNFYNTILRQERGKTITDELDVADGVAMLNGLKKLHDNLMRGNINPIKRYLHFSESLFLKNPYTAKYIKRINDDSNRKDADTEFFMTQLTNRKEGTGIREMLTLNKFGNENWMWEAERVLEMYHQAKYYQHAGKLKKAQSIRDDIKKALRNSKLNEQVNAINDIVLALDGQIDPLTIKSKYGSDGPNVYQGYLKARKLLDDIIDYDQRTYWENIGPPDKEVYQNPYTKKNQKSWQYSRLQELRKRLAKEGYDAKSINKIVKESIVPVPEKRDNYYPHVYFEEMTDAPTYMQLLKDIDSMEVIDITNRIKELSAWKKRRHEHQKLDDMADRNIFSVISRRANSSVNARWTNKFKQNTRGMLEDLNTAIKQKQSKGIVAKDEIKQLKQLVDMANDMFTDVSTANDFSYVRSVASIARGLFLTNLLMLSTKGIVRNKTQGIIPNIIEFGGRIYRKGAALRKTGINPQTIEVEQGGKKRKIEVGKEPGDVVLPNGTVKNYLKELGIGRADIFAKVEGGQEWDIFKSLQKASELQRLAKEGTIAQKAKFYTKEWLQSAEANINKMVKTAGETNIFWVVGGLTRGTFKGLYNTFVSVSHKLPSTEITRSDRLSFTAVEYDNRIKTANMAFYSMWSKLDKLAKTRSGGEDVPLSVAEKNYETSLRFARDMVDKLQFNYNMWNRPKALRKLPTTFQYKSFALGTLNMHWDWWNDFRLNPYQNIRKVSYAAFTIGILSGLEYLTQIGLRRFFEIPEWEYFDNFRDWMFGNYEERTWAFYGNKVSPVTGPLGGLVFELALAVNLFNDFDAVGDTDVDRKNLAWYRIISSLVPGIREVDEIYGGATRSIHDGWGKVANNIFEYMGLYTEYKEPEGLKSLEPDFKPLEPDKWKSPLRQLPKYVRGEILWEDLWYPSEKLFKGLE